jgi:hypothetical protein
LAVRRTPSLLQLAAGALTGAPDGRAHSAFRDEIVGLFRASADASWREIRRGVEDLDAFTRLEDGSSQPSRRFRVKP